MYSTLASINWMFLEGLLLHSRITISIFDQDPPFKLYYFIGWGLCVGDNRVAILRNFLPNQGCPGCPLILIVAWAVCMSRHLESPCWQGYGHSPYVWILTGPMIGVLLVNFCFLVNIIRILVTKMKSRVTLEMTQVRNTSLYRRCELRKEQSGRPPAHLMERSSH
ncbi:pdfr-1 [Cordylochernes scorpioides]|uniref:Pdfr-1 n=1 Tax=Cordylochernes scorpioides TaxID=51811 RepID=A0ABY6K3F8_9ARAC|nr:pdfr-1 [Cordylochernes scorpioides]